MAIALSHSLQRVWRLATTFLAIAVFSGISGCKPRVPEPRPLPGTKSNDGGVPSTGGRVEIVDQPGRPPLQLVRRNGDPSGAVAVAVFPPGGTAASLQLAALLRTRLENKGSVHRLRSHGIGFVLAREIGDPATAAAWMDQVHEALHRAVTADDVAAMKSLPLLAAARRRADSLSPYGLCMGSLGAEGSQALEEALQNIKRKDYPQFLEQLREDSVTTSRVGLSALGGEKLLEQVRAAHSRDWVQGAALDDSWSPEDQAAVASAQGARELRLAVRVADAAAALAGARALRDRNNPVYGRLNALDPHLSLGDVQVTLRPSGACLGLRVSFAGDQDPSLERVAAIALLAKQELEAAVRQKPAANERASAILRPEGALEAVALAAWTAVRSSRVGAKHQEILEYRSTGSLGATHQALGKAVQSLQDEWKNRSLPFKEDVEEGQAEVWLMLGSPCGTAPEGPGEAGLRALTVHAITSQMSGKSDVMLEPWVSSSGLGWVAHGARLEGETSTQHAQRIARVLGSALTGEPLDGRNLASTRARLLDRLGNDPGVEVAMNILGAGHPAAADPYGTSKTLATLSVADAERARADMAQEPLRVAVLANATREQSQVARRALEQWLAPVRDHVTTCPTHDPEPIAPGTWGIETTDEQISPSAVVTVYAPVRPEVGHATAYLLNRRGGYLDRAFSRPDLVANTKASYWGNEKIGGLRVDIHAEPHLLEQATHQTRALLDTIANQGVPEDDAREAIAQYERLESSLLRSPRGRLLRLYRSTPVKSPTPQTLRSFHQRLAGPGHRVVSVRRRQ